MRNSILLLSVLFILSSAGCRQDEVKSTWAHSALTIDGQMEDWKDAPFVVLEDEHVAIGVENDGEYLYIAGKIADAALRRMVERAGLTLWIDPEGGTDDNLEIRFPASSLADLRRGRGAFWESLTEEEKSRAQEQLDERRNGILLIDKRRVRSQIYPARSRTGFAAGIASSAGLTTFEFRLPINLREYVPGLESIATSGGVGLGVKIGRSFDREIGDFRGGIARTPGPIGGRGRGSRVPRQTRETAESSQGSEFWLAITLATSK
jgi:hypothetical protein